MKKSNFSAAFSLLCFSSLLGFLEISNAQSLEQGDLVPISYCKPGEATTEDPTCCGSNVFSSLAAICKLVDLTGNGCGTTLNLCGRGAKEMFSGTTIELAGPGNIKYWNGFGGLGQLYNSAAVCMMRDLKNQPAQKITTSAETSLIRASTEQEVGLTSFNQADLSFSGYHRLKACGPAVGCLDMFTQKFEMKPVVSNVVSLNQRAGAYAIKESYAIQVTSDGIAQYFTTDLPSIIVPTPIGPVDVTPQFRVGRAAGLIMAPFNGNTQSSFPSTYLSAKNNKTYDVYGRMPGVNKSTMSPLDTPLNDMNYKFSQKAWTSTLALGGRDASIKVPVWSPGQDPFPKRPDLDPSIARSKEEKIPNAYMGASAEVTYDITHKLPSALLNRIKCSGGFVQLCLNEASVFAKPSFDMAFSSQLSFLQNEQSNWKPGVYPGEFGTPKLTPDTFDQSRDLNILANSTVTAMTSLESGLGLDLELKVKGPWGFTKKLINLHPRVTIPLLSESGFSDPNIGPSARSLGSDVISDKRFFQQYTSWDKKDLASIGADGGLNALLACVKAPTIPYKEPPPADYTKGRPEDLVDILEQPCNICVAWDEEKYKDENDIEQTLAAGLFNVFPTPQSKFPASQQWVCARPAQLGCYDLCKYEPSGARVVTHTAIQLIATGSQASADMPKSCKLGLSPVLGHP